MKSTLLLFTLLTFAVSAQVTVFQTDFSAPGSYIANPGTNGSWVVTSTGPQGSNSQLMGVISSTSGGDFALFDSEFVATSGADQLASITMTGNADATGYPFVYVCFESYYKHDAGFCWVQASVDGGSTWTHFPVHDNMISGATTANPEMMLVDISAVASGASTITIGFFYEGAPGFAWMVDDVCVQASNSPLVGEAEYSLDRNVKVYPNPSNGDFRIHFSELVDFAEVKISDAQGRSMDQFTVNGLSEVNYTLSGDAGMYFITVRDKTGSEKVVPFVKN